MPRRLAEADSSEQAPGAFGFPCCGPAPFANYPFDIIDIGSQVESRQPFQSPEVGLTQSIKAGHVRNGLFPDLRRNRRERLLRAQTSHSPRSAPMIAKRDPTAVQWVVVKVRFVLFVAAA